MFEGKMTSGELADRAGVSQKALRLYDEKGLLKPAGYSEGNYRLYDEHSLVELEKIIALKQIGFSLEEIREHLEKEDHIDESKKRIDEKNKTDISRILQKQMEMMDEKIRSLQKAKNCIQAILARTDGNPSWEDAAEIIRKMQSDQEATQRHLYAARHQADNIDWYQKIFRSLEIGENDRILDLGCGYGKLWRNNWNELPGNIRVDCYDLHESHAENFEAFLNDHKNTKDSGSFDIQIHWDDVESGQMWENLKKQKELGYHKVIAHYLLHMVKDKRKFIERASAALLSGGMFSVNYYGINAEYDYWENVFAEAGIHEKFVKEQREQNRNDQEKLRELLVQYFREVNYVRLPGPLLFDDPALFYERLLKRYPMGSRYLLKHKDRLMKLFTQKIDGEGRIILEADTGFWHCYK